MSSIQSHQHSHNVQFLPTNNDGLHVPGPSNYHQQIVPGPSFYHQQQIMPLHSGGLSLAAAATKAQFSSHTEVHIHRGGGGQQSQIIQPQKTSTRLPHANYSRLLHHNDPPRFFGHPSGFRESCGGKRIVWEPIEHIADMEMKICYISSLHDEPIVNDFMTPEIIEEIHFDGPISQCNIEILLKPLLNLKYLEVHISALEQLELGSCNVPLYLENLESLEISTTFFTPYHTTCIDICAIINNAMFLLQYVFPHLSFLAVSMPTYPPMEVQWTHTILSCISNHHKTLRYLNIDSQFKINPVGNCSAFAPQKIVPVPVEDMDFVLGELHKVHLISFHYFSRTRSSKIGLWRKFTRNQTRLEYCQLWCEEYYFPIPYDMIQRNAHALHTLALNVDVLSGNHQVDKPIHGTIFEKCVKLVTLFLKGNSQHCAHGGKSHHQNQHRHHPSNCGWKRAAVKPDIIDVTSFPKSLVTLKLIDILLHESDTGFIVQRLPNLAHLYLKGIGECEELGLSAIDLHYVLSQKQLKTIEIIGGINRISLDDVPDDSGFHTMAKILFKNQKVSSFRGKLNKETNEYDAWSSEGEEDDEEGDEDDEENFDQDFEEVLDDDDEEEDEEGDDKDHHNHHKKHGRHHGGHKRRESEDSTTSGHSNEETEKKSHKSHHSKVRSRHHEGHGSDDGGEDDEEDDAEPVENHKSHHAKSQHQNDEVSHKTKQSSKSKNKSKKEEEEEDGESEEGSDDGSDD